MRETHLSGFGDGGHEVASEAGKGKETGSPPELLEGKQACPHPDVSSLKRVSNFWTHSTVR